MRARWFGLATAGIVAVAAPALAQDAAGGPRGPITITAGATLISDYRLRGISQTGKRVAIQGTLTVGHSSGFYATIWGSSIHDYVANGGDAEVDLIAGYRKSFGGVTFDGGVLYYYYPGSGKRYASDFVEPYVSLAYTLGPVTARGTANYAPRQAGVGLDSRVGHGGPKQDNLYLAGDVSAAIPQSPIAVTAHVGHTFGPSRLSIGRSYTDWSLGASYTYRRFTVGLTYVDTNKDLHAVGPVRDISEAGIVGSVSAAF